VTRDRYKEQRREVLGRLKTSSVRPEDQRFIKQWLVSMPSYSLEHRLRRLHKPVVVDIDWTVNEQRMARIRNQLAHGVTGMPPDELSAATDQAMSLARQLVMRELAISDSR
jgi:hypothetical protein